MGGGQRGGFDTDTNCNILITGGSLIVNASGDGIDSNGNLYVTGGETYVSGPMNAGNGALDYGGEACVTGGVFVAVGSSGMAQNFGSSSSQGTMLVNLSGQEEGEIILTDSAGTEFVTYFPEKQYQSVLISCPQIQEGETYVLTAGQTNVSIEMTSLIYGSAGGGGNGMPGDRGMKGNSGMKGGSGMSGEREM